MTIQTKIIDFHITSTKELSNEKGNIGIVEGWASTFGNEDLVNDVIEKGAFADTINEWQMSGKNIPMLVNHDPNKTIGGFDPLIMRETEKGLFVKGEIDLDVQKGKETHSLLKKGFLNSFSIGFSIPDGGMDIIDDKRIIKKIKLWETSIVTTPANPMAQVSNVKGATPFKDLPLSSRDRGWDKNAAVGRVRQATDSVDSPGTRYRNAFLWFDSADADSFGAYKLPFADVVDGKLTAIPRAIFAAAAAIQGARGGVDIPAGDVAKVKSHIDRYYSKMDLDSPFKEKNLDLENQDITLKEVEEFLVNPYPLSKKESKTLISRIKSTKVERDADVEDQNDDSRDAIISKIDEHLACMKLNGLLNNINKR